LSEQSTTDITPSLPTANDHTHIHCAIGAQCVNRRKHHSPKRKHGRDLKNMKAIHNPAVLEGAEEDHDFAGKVRQAGKTDRGKSAKSKRKPSEGHHLGKAAKFIEDQCACPLS